MRTGREGEAKHSWEEDALGGGGGGGEEGAVGGEEEIKQKRGITEGGVEYC